MAAIQEDDWVVMKTIRETGHMNILTRVAGVAAGTIRTLTSTVNIMTGGLQIRTEDVPVSSAIAATFSLADVRRWIARNLISEEEPVKIAVVREPCGQLWKLTLVILSHRNKRCFDGKGRLRAQSQLVRSVAADLDEMLAGRHLILLSP